MRDLTSLCDSRFRGTSAIPAEERYHKHIEIGRPLLAVRSKPDAAGEDPSRSLSFRILVPWPELEELPLEREI